MSAMLPHSPPLPHEPYVEVEKPWSMGECGNTISFDGYSMLIDFVIEGLAQRDHVSGAIFRPRSPCLIGSKPKVSVVKKMKPRPINQRIVIGAILRPEAGRRLEDLLEPVNNSPVVTAVGSEAEALKHLKCSFKVNDATLLLQGEGSPQHYSRPV